MHTNTAIGYRTLNSNTVGTYNTAIVRSALLQNTIGSHNTAIGSSALRNNITGGCNTAIGYQALYRNTTGSHNTAIGFRALRNNTSGSNNIAFGQNAGCFLSGSSSNNIVIRFGSGPSSNTQESDKLYIASGSGTPLIKGDFANKTVNISGSLTATSLTGSLLGTASFAVSASRSVTSSFALSAPATTPGGSSGQFQYNNSGVFNGTSTLNFDGTIITVNPIFATGYFIPQNVLGSLTTIGFNYTISEPGIYRFTSMDPSGSNEIVFPDPTAKDPGQTLIIINADTTYAGYYEQTYDIQDPSGTAITIIGVSQADTFVNIEGIWIRTARRP